MDLLSASALHVLPLLGYPQLGSLAAVPVADTTIASFCSASASVSAIGSLICLLAAAFARALARNRSLLDHGGPSAREYDPYSTCCCCCPLLVLLLAAVVFNLVVLALAAGSSSLPLLFDFFSVAEGGVDVLSDDDDDDDGCVVLVDTVTLLLLIEGSEDTTTGHLCSPGTLLAGELPAVDLKDDDDDCFLDCFFDLLDEASVGARRGILVWVS